MSATVLPSTERNPEPRKGMVIVHGAGHFAPGYEEDLIRRIKEELHWDQEPENLPVCYAHWAECADVNKTRVQVVKFKSTFRNQVEYDQVITALMGKNPDFSMLASILGAASPLFSLATMLPQFLPKDFLDELRHMLDQAQCPGGIDLTGVVEEVGRYLLDPDLRGNIQGELIQALHEAVQKFDEIILVSHSLGTVVAFEVLRARADQYGKKISYWFTLGCPLAKLARVRPEMKDLGKIMRDTVAHWYNVYDNTDFVADALGQTLSTPAYQIHDIFVNVATDPIASHDYFTNPQTLRLIAEVIGGEK